MNLNNLRSSASTKNIRSKLMSVAKERASIEAKGYNTYHKSTYITLESILDTILPILERYNLFLFEGDLEIDGKDYYCAQVWFDEEYIGSYISLTPHADPKQRGSEITYLRRYTLMKLFNIPARGEEDDDGMYMKKKQANTPKYESIKEDFNNDEGHRLVSKETFNKLHGLLLTSKSQASLKAWIESKVTMTSIDNAMEITEETALKAIRAIQSAKAKSPEKFIS